MDYLAAEAGTTVSSDGHVIDVDDGGMGSVRFVDGPVGEERLASSCQFLDTDGLPVVVDLFVSAGGQPVALTFWKVDYSATRAFPNDLATVGPVKYRNTH